jgi:hypothetical protein
MNKQFIVVLLGLLILLVSACSTLGLPEQTIVPEGEVDLFSETAEPEVVQVTIERPLYLEKRKADSQEPAAGICAEDRSPVVTVEISLESPPSPRCLIVYAGSVLNIRNTTFDVVEIELSGNIYRLEPGREGVISQDVAEYLESGVHILPVEGGYVPAIWVK